MNTTTLRDIEIRPEVKLHSDGKTLFNGESTLPLLPLHNSNLTIWNENFMYPSIEFAQPFYRRSNFSERSISRLHRLHVIQMCMGRKQVRLLLLKSNYACCKFSGRKRAYLSSFHVMCSLAFINNNNKGNILRVLKNYRSPWMSVMRPTYHLLTNR